MIFLSNCLILSSLTSRIYVFIIFLCILPVQPGMILDTVEPDPRLVVDSEARPDQSLALQGDLGQEHQLPLADGIVALERNVPTDHVIEEDPQGPHGEAVSIILLVLDPLRRSIHSCT